MAATSPSLVKVITWNNLNRYWTSLQKWIYGFVSYNNLVSSPFNNYNDNRGACNFIHECQEIKKEHFSLLFVDSVLLQSRLFYISNSINLSIITVITRKYLKYITKMTFIQQRDRWSSILHLNIPTNYSYGDLFELTFRSFFPFCVSLKTVLKERVNAGDRLSQIDLTIFTS